MHLVVVFSYPARSSSPHAASQLEACCVYEAVTSSRSYEYASFAVAVAAASSSGYYRYYHYVVSSVAASSPYASCYYASSF